MLDPFEYNILDDGEGPVIIDLQQAINAADKSEAAAMVESDVENLTNHFSRSAPQLA